eukprot:gene2839-3132_t
MDHDQQQQQQQQREQKLDEVGLPFLGAFPEDKLLRGVRLDEVLPALGAELMYGYKEQLDQYFDANTLVAGLEKEEAIITSSKVMTPKMFAHRVKMKCIENPQHIVLPEGAEPRVIKAANDVVSRGLAKITLLGNPVSVAAEAKRLGTDISQCQIIDPKTFPGVEKYVAALLEARKGKNLTQEVAYDAVVNDVNMFGVMMVAMGDAAGMVSGSIHTTAATIRPAMQVLVYGDCAVNVTPSSQDLASIAICSADTAAAFGIEPRVAMLSYSTMGSGAGPDVQKVTDAVKLVKEARPDLMVEGPLQYDAAIDPAVASVKIKTHSEVAGKANVFIFPDLNTGNNTYKAVQQVGIVEAFGKFQRLAYPGCNCLNPCCGEGIAGVLSLRVHQLDVKCETKTKDNVFVVLVVCVQYQVRKEQIYDAFYKLTNSHSQISSYVYDVVRASVPKMKLDEVFLEKEAIALSIKEELTKSMGAFGFDILQALVNDIAPAGKVKDAMNEINAAQRLRMAAVEKAEAAKIKVVKEAEAEAEAKFLQGAGVARQRQAIVAGLQHSVKDFKKSVQGVAAQDVLELMLVTQYFDMLREVGANHKANTIFTPSAGGEGDGLMGAGQLSAALRTCLMEAGCVQSMSRA